jgi:hypothetical protein
MTVEKLHFLANYFIEPAHKSKLVGDNLRFQNKDVSKLDFTKWLHKAIF